MAATLSNEAPAGRRPGALRAAVIGAGAISAQHLAYLGPSEWVDLVGVCDLSPAAARIAARKSGAAGHFTDVAEMLEVARPDVVHVLTPPEVHGFLVRAALDAGAHVICEKPMAPTGAEAEELLAAAEAAGRHLIENHNYRFNEEILALRELIDADRIGRVEEVDIRLTLPIRDPGSRFADENLPSPIHQLPAGVIHDFVTHFAYLLGDLSGYARWERVAALWSNHGGGDLFTTDDLDAVLVGAVDSGPVHGRLRFSARQSPDVFTVTVRGSEGYAVTDLFHPHLDVVAARPVGDQLSPFANHVANGVGRARSGLSNFGRKLLQHTPYHGLSEFLDRTYAAIAAGEEPPVGPFHIRYAADVIDRLVAERPSAAGEVSR